MKKRSRFHKMKNTPSILFVWIVCAVAITTTTVWLYRVDFVSLSATRTLDSLFEILSAAILAMLAAAISSFIFLHGELQSRKENNKFMKRAIDGLHIKISKTLTINCVIGLIAFIACVYIFESHPDDKFRIGFLSFISYISLAWLLDFNITIINHDNAILEKAFDLLHQEYNSLGSSFTWETVTKSDNFVSKFFKECSDVQKILEKITENHSKQVEGTPAKDRLKEILTLKTLDSNDSADLAAKCSKLIEYRDLLLIVAELGQESTKVDIPTDLPLSVKGRLIKGYVANELLTGIALSSQTLYDGRFDGTSFADSLLYAVTFSGDNQCLDRSSFFNTRLIDIKFNLKNQVVGINFSRAVFISTTLPIFPFKFKLCNFKEADFSKQKHIQDIDFHSSNFEQANFSGEDSFYIQNTSFELANCSNTNFVAIKIIDSRYINANCTGAEFTYAIIKSSKFNFATLESAVLFQTKLENIDFTNCRLAKANFIETDISVCIFDDSYCNYVSFQHSIIKGSSFDHAVLIETDFSHCEIYENTSFVNANCSSSILIQTKATTVKYNSAIFVNSQILSGRYDECDFTDAMFDGSILSGVLFCKCDFTNASFRGTVLRDVDFCECIGLNGESFHEAIVDKKTNDKLNCYCCAIVRNINSYSISTNEPNITIFDNLLKDRKSTRLFQPDFEIADEILSEIINAARLAPSAKNRQPWRFCIVKDREKINGIADIMDSNDDQFRNSSVALRSASIVIFVCYDSDGDDNHCGPDIQSIGAAIENLVLKATDLNIQSLWMCDTLDFHEQIKEYLSLNCDFVATILLGIEADKPRKKLEDITEIL